MDRIRWNFGRTQLNIGPNVGRPNYTCCVHFENLALRHAVLVYSWAGQLGTGKGPELHAAAVRSILLQAWTVFGLEDLAISRSQYHTQREREREL